MRRIMALAAFALAALLTFSVSASASSFRFVCNTCDGSDSGTATGDGTGSVGTSDGTAGFTGAVPSFDSLGLRHPKDLRFNLTIAVPTTEVPTSCNPRSPELSCDFNYSAINVQQLRFFVTTTSTYCQQVPSPCATIASVRLGEHFADDVLQTVIFSAPLVADSGIQLDLGEQTTLQLTNKQALELYAQMKTVQKYDPDAQFFVGFAVLASAVDPDPTDTNGTRIIPFSEILFVDTLTRK